MIAESQRYEMRLYAQCGLRWSDAMRSHAAKSLPLHTRLPYARVRKPSEIQQRRRALLGENDVVAAAARENADKAPALSQFPQPLCYRGTDLVRGILLQEVAALNGHLLLIFPGATQLPHIANEDTTRIAVNEQLRNIRLGHPS